MLALVCLAGRASGPALTKIDHANSRYADVQCAIFHQRRAIMVGISPYQVSNLGETAARIALCLSPNSAASERERVFSLL